MDHFNYMWAITLALDENNLLKKTRLFLNYPNYISSKFKLTWVFGCSSTLNNHLLTYISIDESELMEEIWANFNFSIIDQKGKKFKSLGSKQACKFVKGIRWGFKEFINKNVILDETNGLLDIDRQFTIICEITASSSESNLASSLSEKIEVPKCSLLDDLWFMYEDKKFSDVTINVKDKEFKAHKNILAVRSPVFFAMFNNDMEEKKNNRVNITDINPPVFEEMLHYIYTGKSPNLDTMAEDLLDAAEKYQIERLKVLCGKALCKKLTVNNAAEILVLADLYNADELKKQTMDFIVAYVTDVEKTEGFESLVISNPLLFKETFRALANKTLEDKLDPIVCLTVECD